MYQHTIANSIEFTGVGVHTGALSHVRVLPSDTEGIVFKRVDLPESPFIKADYTNILKTDYATTIGIGNATISTIEHMLAAFYATGVDNAIVEVNAPEVPVLDGSSADIVKAIERVGLRRLNAKRRFIRIKKAIRIDDGDRFVCILPFRKREADELLTIEYTMDFNHRSLDRQTCYLNLTKESFKAEVMEARTFGFLKDVEMLRKHGLARGGTLDNAVVIDENLIMNDGGLRYPDEFVRHKVLDLVGDISLAGYPLIGRVKAYKSGHGLNAKLATAIAATPANWEYVELRDDNSIIHPPPAAVVNA
ncbi:MAG: UDP-3-O-acyl-N-acetylglucosamine deacetylase [Deltaproteobacteria bacterium]|nr:UDP-3-O-acyl-N-acetylglucosamine deacetylase [Deltaproteobacteria bacterium]